MQSFRTLRLVLNPPFVHPQNKTQIEIDRYACNGQGQRMHALRLDRFSFIELQFNFYFRRYQHSKADIIIFQFRLLGMHKHFNYGY